VVRIPLAKAGQHDEKASPQAEQPKENPQGTRVLVVDDHADSADSLSLVLEYLGHEVKTAYDSKSALNLARTFHPAVIFCDLGLPLMDGYEVAGKLRSFPETRNAILVALTGYGQEDDKARSLRAGFDFHLVKPVSPGSLQTLLSLPSANSDMPQSVVEGTATGN
jgi:CheY-like chemotaxis protein